MKTIKALVAVTVVLSLLGASHAFAQGRMRGRGGDGWSAGGPYNRMYNPGTVETIQGEVLDVNRTASMRGMSTAVVLTLKTDKESIPVHLGPSWFFSDKGIPVRAGDSIQVTGSRVNFDGKPAILAAKVKKGSEVMELRDANGVPAWSGRRR
ncbi:MAG: DNA-binding protein [Deltaproteobacteria bacterium]|nr:DNA-binding protein [Deltaproteobacteria bacterium]